MHWIESVLAVTVALIFVYLSVDLYTQAECLRNGYPKHAISVGLERYCMNLTGSVTVKVEKAGK